jgi:hypothetical protein
MKVLLTLITFIFIAFMFFLAKALSKPIYNKMHNVWQDDSDGRKMADILIIIMILTAFVTGLLI